MEKLTYDQILQGFDRWLDDQGYSQLALSDDESGEFWAFYLMQFDPAELV